MYGKSFSAGKLPLSVSAFWKVMPSAPGSPGAVESLGAFDSSGAVLAVGTLVTLGIVGAAGISMRVSGMTQPAPITNLLGGGHDSAPSMQPIPGT
ncbi:hypothetical protein FACS18948_5000 [Clostridia bacterium]|nr:hypothetical protein FACS18948_5000 [Clostridia bacterium]